MSFIPNFILPLDSTASNNSLYLYCHWTPLQTLVQLLPIRNSPILFFSFSRYFIDSNTCLPPSYSLTLLTIIFENKIKLLPWRQMGLKRPSILYLGLKLLSPLIILSSTPLHFGLESLIGHANTSLLNIVNKGVGAECRGKT